jgi:hypothetical protein
MEIRGQALPGRYYVSCIEWLRSMAPKAIRGLAVPV